jgi:hypothetical protein
MPNHSLGLFYLTAFRVSVGCLLGMAMSGCAVIDQMHGDGTTTRSFALGPAVIMATDASGQSNVTKVNGLGIIASNTTATMGWFDETVASLGPDCRVVLIGNTEQELQHFAALISKNKGICSDAIPDGGQK